MRARDGVSHAPARARRHANADRAASVAASGAERRGAQGASGDPGTFSAAGQGRGRVGGRPLCPVHKLRAAVDTGAGSAYACLLRLTPPLISTHQQLPATIRAVRFPGTHIGAWPWACRCKRKEGSDPDSIAYHTHRIDMVFFCHETCREGRRVSGKAVCDRGPVQECLPDASMLDAYTVWRTRKITHISISEHTYPSAPRKDGGMHACRPIDAPML